MLKIRSRFHNLQRTKTSLPLHFRTTHKHYTVTRTTGEQEGLSILTGAQHSYGYLPAGRVVWASLRTVAYDTQRHAGAKGI